MSATCVQALIGLAVGPLTNTVAPPRVPPPEGRKGPLSLLALRKYASTSRCTMVRQPLCAAVGWIHASSVMAAPRFSDAELATRTRLFTPLKLSAPPQRPAVLQANPPLIVPVLPLPEASVMVVPAPSFSA